MRKLDFVASPNFEGVQPSLLRFALRTRIEQLDQDTKGRRDGSRGYGRYVAIRFLGVNPLSEDISMDSGHFAGGPSVNKLAANRASQHYLR